MLGGANYSSESLLAPHISLTKRSLVEANFGGLGAASSTCLLHMPPAYPHGQLTGSLSTDGVLMGWEDRLLNTAQLLRFNYRARLPLSQHWHSGGRLKAGGQWGPDSCLGSCCLSQPPRLPPLATVPLICTAGGKHHVGHSPLC